MEEFKHTTEPRPFTYYERPAVIRAYVRFDNDCGNREPSFGLTGGIYIPQHIPYEEKITYGGLTHWLTACGCCHEEIAKAFPELEPYVKWHLCSPSGPMHYFANGEYWHKLWGDSLAGPPWDTDKYVLQFGTDKLREHFCSTVVFTPGEASLDDVLVMDKDELKAWLTARLPGLQQAFAADMQALKALSATL